MSPLREQLQSARREYQSIHYSGDLSQEVLRSGMRFRGRVVVAALMTGAVAASALLTAVLARPLLIPASSQPHSSMPLVREIPMPQKMPFGLPSLPSLPRLAPHFSLREMAPSLVPAEGLHLPSLDDLHMPLMSDRFDHA